MHMIFTEEELRYIDTKQFGFPVKKDCPEKIRKSIEKKKRILDKQMEGVFDGRRKH